MKINILTTFLWCVLFACAAQQTTSQTASTLKVGAEQFEEYLPFLQNKRVAFVVNQTSRVGEKHLVDELLARKINIVKVFAPEHGFRGDADAGEKVGNETDKKTGLTIVSLYGTNYKPSKEQLQDVDVVVFDIQDVGVRYYTYIGTMHYVMEACAEAKKTMLILDRPNPNGDYVDGNILDMKVKSFVGMHPVPTVHGLTVAEYAQMINGEKWLQGGVQCDLKIVKCKNYTHQTKYSLPVRPSPNLSSDRAVELYPTLCLFEGTIVSMGRGTDFPFQVLGYPENPIKDFSFTPKSVAGAKSPPFKDLVCYGKDYRSQTNWKNRFSLEPLISFYRAAPNKDKFFNAFFNKLAGTEELRRQIETGKTEDEIRATWAEGLEKYKQTRKKYLIYE